ATGKNGISRHRGRLPSKNKNSLAGWPKPGEECRAPSKRPMRNDKNAEQDLTSYPSIHASECKKRIPQQRGAGLSAGQIKQRGGRWRVVGVRAKPASTAAAPVCGPAPFQSAATLRNPQASAG